MWRLETTILRPDPVRSKERLQLQGLDVII